MYSLRSLYRIMLLTWLILVLCMGLVLAYNVGSNGQGKLFAFLFPSTQTPPPLAPVVVPQAPQPVPAPAIAPPVEPAKPQTEWIALQKGKEAAKGTLSKPEITTLATGEVEVRFTYTNTPGNYRAFHPTNVDSLSVDLLGPWGKNMLLDKRLDKGILKRVQVADHKQWVRVSGIARDSTVTLEAKVEYDPKIKALRIVFAKQR